MGSNFNSHKTQWTFKLAWDPTRGSSMPPGSRSGKFQTPRWCRSAAERQMTNDLTPRHRVDFVFPDRVHMPDPPNLAWASYCNNDGHILVGRLLRRRLPHDLYDYIIEGLSVKLMCSLLWRLVAEKLDFSMAMAILLLLHALRDFGSSCPSIRRNSVIMVVYPTKWAHSPLDIEPAGLILVDEYLH